MTQQVLRCDTEGPGSRAEIVDYVEGVLRENTTLQPHVNVSSHGDDAKRHRLATNMVYSILHRLGIEQVTDLDTGNLM